MRIDQLRQHIREFLGFSISDAPVSYVAHETIAFQRNLWGQVTGVQGDFSFEPYNISLPYDLIRSGVVSYNTSLWITIVSVGIALILLAAILLARRRRRNADGTPG